jgi:hypothetical protein
VSKQICRDLLGKIKYRRDSSLICIDSQPIEEQKAKFPAGDQWGNQRYKRMTHSL